MFVRAFLTLWASLLCFSHSAVAIEPQYVVATIDGELMRVRDDRRPSLFTADFGDCLGESAINVTRFDAAYYKDNMTIIFHLAGETALKNESIMMNIGVFAYGESRFDLTFNPCNANIRSACPVQAGTTIEAEGIIPVNQDDVAGIPSIALTIPDFEGQAILRIFSNSTQNEIGCFAAQITNGNTFRQSAAIGSILGVVTLLAFLASSATAVYGDNIIETRKHYAHSLSLSIIFAVWHHIYYSGALSMNWPSILVAFWSNYAWTGGMIYSENMQNAINNFIGSNKGNTSHVGAAGTGAANPDLGGGVDLRQIYGRDITGVMPLAIPAHLARRHLVDATDGFQYYGQPVKPGLPLPGNYSGFAGTLSQQKIPASNSFMTGFLWLLVLIAIICTFIITLKIALASFSHFDLISKDRLSFFRAHYLRFTGAAVLRTLFASFFMMAFLTMFQFSYLAVAGPVAVACIVFIIIVFGLGSIAAFAFYSNIDLDFKSLSANQLVVCKRMISGFLPWLEIKRKGECVNLEDRVVIFTLPWFRTAPATPDKSVANEEQFTNKFGWLSARYRRTRWWFFIVWYIYEFIRACFLAGASRQPMVQVIGLLLVELSALGIMIVLRPFEGQRLNIIVTYLLGISKVVTVALSAAFDARFAVARIPATVIAIGIILVQGLLTIMVMLAVLVSLVTSYMSITRNREEIKPRSWNTWRSRYFERLDFAALDIPRPQPECDSVPVEPVRPAGPYFTIKEVKRMAKVEDEDIEFMREAYHDSAFHVSSTCGLESNEVPGASSRRDEADKILIQTSHSILPRAARLHRMSWSTLNRGEPRPLGGHRTLSNSMSATCPPQDGRSNSALSVRVHGSSDANGSTQSRTVDTDNSDCVSDCIAPVGLSLGTYTAARNAGSRARSKLPMEYSISEEDDVPPSQDQPGGKASI
ncbi:hypothetical protein ACN47E_006609 [Coniothyrium glycines]